MRCCVSFVVIIFRSFKKLRRSGEFKKQLKAVYNNIYSKNFDAEDFICKNKEVIDTLPLEPEEHAIIKDLFTYKYIPDKEYMPDICTICQEQFDHEGLLLIDFPHCGHTYHFTCLVGWLERQMNCPMCKATIRASIIRSIVNKNYINKDQQNPLSNTEFTEINDTKTQILDETVIINSNPKTVSVNVDIIQKDA